MNAIDVQPVLPTLFELGEGSLWDDRRRLLYWVDIHRNQVFELEPGSGAVRTHDVGESVGTVVLTENDKLLLGLRNGIAWLDPDTEELTYLVDPEADRPGNRFNDGKCDPQGRFWVGTMVEQGPPGAGALYCLEKDLSLSKKLGGVTTSNGLIWSHDSRQFFYIDTPTQQVQAFDFDPSSGSLGPGRVVAEIPREMGGPDGMTIDEEGYLWIALWGGGAVIRVNPGTGEVVLTVNIPARNVTSCAFGGPLLEDLYVTTAHVGLGPAEREAQPAAGALFRARVPARGTRAHRFGRSLVATR